MVILAAVVLILSVLALIGAVSNEEPGKILGMLLVISVFMSTPWAFMTVLRWFTGV